MVAVLLIAFFALLIFGTPIITALMGSSLLSFAMYSTKDLKAVAQAMFASNGSFSLLAIPLFVLAGALMSSGGISKRLIKFFDKLVGWMPGGMAIVAVLACAFFGALSGSAPATVAAIGGIMIPAMVEKDYDTPWTTCLLASSGSLGAIIHHLVFQWYCTVCWPKLLFPPCSAAASFRACLSHLATACMHVDLARSLK